MDKPHIFCFQVDSWPKWLILLVCAVGIFSMFLLHGIAHEKLFSSPYFFVETIFLTFTQFISYSMISIHALKDLLFGQKKLKASFYIYFLTSITLALSMSLGNFAALRLSYATEVLFKSSKLIPVMIGNIIFLKKKPKLIEAISICLVVLGLIGVSLGDFRGKNKFDMLGIIAVITSLCFDAIASNMEDKIMSVYGASQDELIAMIYGIGAILVGSISIITGEFFSAMVKIFNHPSSLIFISLFSFLGAIGIQFVYLTMKVFGSLLTVMMTSIRKALTVCLSFLVFPDKKFTKWHGFSIVLLSIGISINIYEKTKKHQNNDENKLIRENSSDIIDEFDNFNDYDGYDLPTNENISESLSEMNV